jgi:O-antigen/teichoic acid export membrane protein
VKRDINEIVKKNIGWGMVLKGMTTVLMLIIVKLNYNSLEIEKYGMWSTLYALISWTIFLDLGISHGTRNLLTKAFAINNDKEAQRIIATSYVLIGSISLFLLALTGILPDSIFARALNLQSFDLQEIVSAIKWLATFVVLNFSLTIVYSILFALQKSALANVGALISNLVSLFFFSVFYFSKVQDLRYYSIAYGISLAGSTIFMTVFTFRKRPDLIPKLKNWDQSFAGPLLRIGFSFFVLQVFTVFIISIGRVLIFNLIGPSSAAKFDIYSRLYSILNVIILVITAPLWSAFTHAYVKNDIQWIQTILKKLRYIMGFFILGGVALFIVSDHLLRFWIGPNSPTDMRLNLLVLAFFLTIAWVTIYATLSNGIGNFRPQALCLLIGCVLCYPLSYVACFTFGLGEYGIVAAQIFSLMIYAIYIPFQIHRHLKVKSVIVNQHIKINESANF